MFNFKSKSCLQAALTLGLTGLLTTSPVLACTGDKADKASSVTQVAKASAPSIVDIAASNSAFSTLVAALKAADLTDVLSGDEKFTVFAPTDEAFAALPEGTLDTLLLPENKETLATILKYHVVPGSVPSTALSTGSVETVAGPSINVDLSEGVAINNASVVQADIEASNGVIHVIDKVLLPPQ